MGSNPYYNQLYIEEFLKKDVPYLSLWSGLLNNGVRYSNQPIEGYIGKLKGELDDCSISMGKRPLPAKSFFQYSHQRTKELGNKYINNLGNRRLSIMPKTVEATITPLEMMDLNENWKGKTDPPRTKFSYLQTKNVSKMKTHFEIEEEEEVWKGESNGALQKRRNTKNLKTKDNYLSPRNLSKIIVCDKCGQSDPPGKKTKKNNWTECSKCKAGIHFVCTGVKANILKDVNFHYTCKKCQE